MCAGLVRIQHLQPGSIGAYDVRLQDPLIQLLHQGFDQLSDPCGPVAQRGDRDLSAAAGVDPMQPMQRSVIGVLTDDDVGKQRGIRSTAFEHLRWGSSRCHPFFTAAAAELLQSVLALDEAAGYILQPSGDVEPHELHRSTAARAATLLFGHLRLVGLPLHSMRSPTRIHPSLLGACSLCGASRQGRSPDPERRPPLPPSPHPARLSRWSAAAVHRRAAAAGPDRSSPIC